MNGADRVILPRCCRESQMFRGRARPAACTHVDGRGQLPVRLRGPERTLRVACRAAAVSGRRAGARAGLVLLLPVGSVQRVLDVTEFVTLDRVRAGLMTG